MKKIFLAIAAIAILAGCGESYKQNKARKAFLLDSLKRAEFVQDSIARAEFVRDSIEAEQRKAEIIARCSPLFSETKDEFSDRVWVKPKSAPKYTNRNATYCYFMTVDGVPSNLRFRFQYHSDNWLFIRNMIFNIDGENFRIAPDMETDSGNGGRIWEWCDEMVYNSSLADDMEVTKENIDIIAKAKAMEVIEKHANSSDGVEYTEINKAFIAKIAYAKSVKIKMNGSQYYDTRTLSAAEIKSIRDTYEYFFALGGTL